MWKTVTYHIWPRNTPFEERLALLPDFAKKRSLQSAKKKIIWDGLLTIQTDQFTRIKCDTMDELLAVMKRCPAYDSFTCNVPFVSTRGDRSLRMGVTYNQRKIEVKVSSNDIDLVESAHAFIKESLGVGNPVVPTYDEGRAKHLQPTVFVGRCFDPTGDSYFFLLSDFLELLGFDVKQGKPYASERIPDKIRKRIEAQDIFVCVASGEEEHPWLVAEPSYALGKGKHLILLVEEEAFYHPTILGEDLEQIRFPRGHIEKTFISLLRELRSVRVKGL